MKAGKDPEKIWQQISSHFFRDFCETGHPFAAEISRISGKILIPRISCQDYLDVILCHLCDIIGWDGRGIGERLVIIPYEFGQNFNGVWFDDELMMFRPKCFETILA